VQGVAPNALLGIGMGLLSLFTGLPDEGEWCKCICRPAVRVSHDNFIDDTSSTRGGQFEDVVVPDDSCIENGGQEFLHRMPFEVALVRSGEYWRTLGVTVCEDESHCLVVDDVRGPGLVTEWNDTHDISLQVQAGDTIVSVNESPRQEDIMITKLQELGKGSNIRLSIIPRPPFFDEGVVTGAASECPLGRRYPELRKHFKTLDVSEEAEPEAICRHYRHLVRIHHPDKHPENQADATKRFQEIMSAFAAIRDRLHLG